MILNLANWGNFPKKICAQLFPYNYDDVNRSVLEHKSVIARGEGRCYGDSALGETVIQLKKLNRFLEFDRQKGSFRCEAGATLDEILSVIVPKGWFLPVTPGTKFVSVGGAIASDVHGKNHHCEGGFSRYVTEIRVMLADGSVRNCGPSVDSELFWATCGGMGLTGIILEATFKLKFIETGYVVQDSIRVGCLAEMMAEIEGSSNVTYSVAWIDCLAKGSGMGRGIVYRGEHARQSDCNRKLRLDLPRKKNVVVPFFFPSWILNRVVMCLFNWLYYWIHCRKRQRHIVSYESFFYPLDRIVGWNKLYGRRGFVQYQFVLPLDTSQRGLEAILARIAESGWGSFLAVLKRLGGSESPLGFARSGYTLALDFPARSEVFSLLDQLDQLVIDFGGRHYLAKDARMSRKTFEAGYSRLGEFSSIRDLVDLEKKMKSMQSERLGL